VLERIAQIQGFDAKPDVGNLDANREVIHRGFGDRFGGNEAKYARQFVHGEYYGSTGGRANGIYFSTDPKVADNYGMALRAQVHPDARVAKITDIEDKLWEDLPEPVRKITGNDAGRLAAMLGYDALTTGGTHRIVLNRGALRVEPHQAGLSTITTAGAASPQDYLLTHPERG
jgi:hypothetical protein